MAHAPGDVVAGYRLLEPLGEGAMGVVYEAEDIRLQRRVAIKFISNVGDVERRRFEQEAKALARIQSRYIVQILQFHTQENGESLLVMERLNGDTLGTRMRGGPMPPTAVVSILMQLCRGLSAAHAVGVIHRDLKPGNIVLAQMDGEESVKILDFGVAKVLDTGVSPLTAEGMILGTLVYMSPEQLRGLSIDCGTDVYALGVLAFKMLTGRVPYPIEALARVVDQLPAPTALVRSLEAHPGVDPALAAVIGACLEPDRRFRIDHVDLVEAELARFSAPSDIAKEPPSTLFDLPARPHERTVATNRVPLAAMAPLELDRPTVVAPAPATLELDRPTVVVPGEVPPLHDVASPVRHRRSVALPLLALCVSVAGVFAYVALRESDGGAGTKQRLPSSTHASAAPATSGATSTELLPADLPRNCGDVPSAQRMFRYDNGETVVFEADWAKIPARARKTARCVGSGAAVGE